MTSQIDLFIVGTGRSGTTLARTILDSHPKVAIPGETGFLPKLLRLKWLWWRGGKLKPTFFVKLAMSNGRLARSGVTKSALIESFSADQPKSPAEAITRIFQVYARLNGAPADCLVGDKTPGYIRHVPLLNEWYPEARIIRLVRHPLSATASLLEQPWAPNTPLANALSWQEDQVAFNDAEASNVMTLRLEDLISQPELSCRKMTDFLGLEFDPAMLDYSRKAKAVMQQNIHPNSHAGLTKGLSAKREWSDHISETDAKLIWDIVGREAAKLGYKHLPVAGRETDARTLSKARSELSRFYWSRRWRSLKTLKTLVGF